MKSLARGLGLALALAALAACETGQGRPEQPAAPRAVRVLAVTAPSPIFPGAWVEVSCDHGGVPVQYVLKPADERFTLSPSGDEWQGRPGFFFDHDPAQEGTLGLPPGPHSFSLEAVFASGAHSEPFPLSLELGGALSPVVEGMGEASFWGDPVVVHGAGFPLYGEGVLRVRLEGEFTPLGGSGPEPAQAETILWPVERLARDRAIFRLPAALGAARPGLFEGETLFRLSAWQREPVDLGRFAVRFDVQPPALFAAAPDEVALGEYVVLNQGGLTYGAEIWPFVVLDGRFEGRVERPVEALQFPLQRLPDGAVVFHFPAALADGALVAAPFGEAKGRFVGELTALVVTPDDSFRSAPLPVTISLTGLRQWVWLHYLPGFHDSLHLFGLQAASLEIQRRVAARVAALYEGLGVRVITEAPTEVSPDHLTRVDIGGPDPNGLGLFGFDNTPGKDVGNLRLADIIGGENAETQEDGYPGYGGVFVESFLFWQDEPLFQEIFAPLLERSVGSEELARPGADARGQQVAAAVQAFANLVAETVAHELGHALGLANPDTPDGAFHNAEDGPGCLMDRGEERPFGERAGLPGFTPTHFCHGHDAYLRAILSAGP